jgi:hypothetical protein
VRDAIAFHALPLPGIDAMSAATARAFPRHTHDQYGIGIVDAGGHASWSGRGQVEAGPGFFISVNPGEVHDGRAIGGRPRAWRILYFDPAALADVRDDITEGAPDALTFTAPVFAMRLASSCSKTRSGTRATHAHRFHDALRDCDSAMIARLRAHSTERPRDELSTACIPTRAAADRCRPCGTGDIDRASKRIRPEPLSADPRVCARAQIDAARLHPAATHRIGAAVDSRRLRSCRGCSTGRLLRPSHLTRWFVRQFGVTPSRYCVVAR